jgi:hypothetical protein
MQNKDIVKMQVHDQKELNRLIKNNETVGKNCSLGGLTVYDSIKQGHFKTSGKLQSSKAIKYLPQNAESWANRKEAEKSSRFGRVFYKP